MLLMGVFICRSRTILDGAKDGVSASSSSSSSSSTLYCRSCALRLAWIRNEESVYFGQMIPDLDKSCI